MRRARDAGARVGKRGQSDAQSWVWGGRPVRGSPRARGLASAAPSPCTAARAQRSAPSGSGSQPGEGAEGLPTCQPGPRREGGLPATGGAPKPTWRQQVSPSPPLPAPQRPSRVPGRGDAESRGCASPGRSRGGRSPDSFHATCCPGPVARGSAAGTVPGGPPPAARGGWEPRSPAGSRANSPLLERGLVGEEDRGARGAATVVSPARRLAAPRQVSRRAPRLSSPPAPPPTGEPLPLGARIPPGAPGTQGASRPRPLKSLCATPAPTGWPPGPGRACDPPPGSGRSGGPAAPSLFC